MTINKMKMKKERNTVNPFSWTNVCSRIHTHDMSSAVNVSNLF
ncbi:unnamed protein product [Spirodela intermedia]|uniref:Uncharacterized protein n=2 Tax=Spirodela intermedia TaxID=51605 RepID=A0A7I8JNZ1_SPIIN|nr:unnamed protein product [Spirodela intermedia]CAA6671820.1 unnamed protein product [Spirodela intermedia]CAA7408949.1 unnamed protein product [Spirodela intermedia]